MTGDTPRLRVSQVEWDTMTTVLGVLAVGAEAALRRQADVQVISHDGSPVATITVASAPQVIVAWQLARQMAVRRTAAPPREGPH